MIKMIVPAFIFLNKWLGCYFLAFASPLILPPFRAGERFVFLPRPEPLRLPPPVILLTVAHARRFASLGLVPRFS